VARLTRDQWRQLAFRALEQFLAERGGAVVWPEVEATLAESDWLHRRLDPSIPRNWVVDPHHLTWARQALAEVGRIARDAQELSGREVVAWVDPRAPAERRKTEVVRLAARKRRAYRSYLSWTTAKLCGDIAESIVDATLRRLGGRIVWLDEQKPGSVYRLQGVEIPGGPLDSAGHWAIDPSDPGAGFVPFAVEVKNVRSTIYPRSREMWDLLAKVGHFPDVVPILVTRRLHWTTFRFLKDIGALAYMGERQWFSPSIDTDEFNRIARFFGFDDAIQVTNPGASNEALAEFFSRRLYRTREDANAPLMLAARDRWKQVASVCAAYDELRKDLGGEERLELWKQFIEDLGETGVEPSGWASPDPAG